MEGGRATASPGELGILIVEDDEGDALLVRDELAEWLPRARIARSHTLGEALAVLGPGIDCVLLDLGLPDASGLEAVARLRERLPTVTLIVLTGLNDEAAGVRAVEAGAQDYLVKGTVDGEQLVRSVRYSLGRRQAEEAERQLLLVRAQATEVARLERGLAPDPLLEDTGVLVGSCYRAGRSRALLGGDFIDLVETPDGSLHVVVGDVCGHGPDEAAIGVSLRAAWRALALAGSEPALTMRTLEQVFAHERALAGLFATVCTLLVDPNRAGASMISAGHPPPVLIADDSVGALSAAGGNRAIGIGPEEDPWLSHRVTLPDKWAVLLYTDGIIEGRVGSGPERLGEAGLHGLLAAQIERLPRWRERPEQLLHALIADAERLNGDALTDDVAMLLVGVR